MANLQVSVQTDYNGRGIRQAQADMQNLDQKTIKQLQDRIKGLQTVLNNTRPNSAAFTRYASEINQAKIALDRLQTSARTVGNTLPTSMGGATSSVIEFNRVIQDAPFGIQGVGNNIQSLTQNLAYLTTQTGSARKATSLFFSTLITPANLAVLAVSAITSAWTVYTRLQQSAAKATKEAAKNQTDYNEGLNDFVDTLSAVDRASVRSSQSTAEETTKLRVLYGITQDVTMGIKERNRAADQLQKFYPAYFQNQSNEAILAGNAASAYDKLTASIISTGKARAAVDISAENSRDLLKIDLRRVNIEEQRSKINERIARSQAKIKELTDSGLAVPNRNSDELFSKPVLDEMRLISKAQIELNELQDTRIKDFTKEVQLRKDQYNLQKLINSEVKKGADIFGKPGADYTPKASGSARADAINKALQDSKDKSNLQGVTGVKQELEKLKQEYADYYRDIDKYVRDSATKGINDVAKGEAAKAQLNKDYLQRRSQIEISEAARVASEVQRIRDDSGVASEQTMEKDFAAITKWYDAEVKKAEGNADILAAIEEGSQARMEAIRLKYYEKYVAAVDALTKKITAIEEQAFAQNKTGLSDETKKLQAEIDKRIKKINELYDAMEKVNQNGALGSAIIAGLRAGSIATVKGNGQQAQNSTDYQSAKALNAAIGKFTSDMYDSVSNVGKKNAEITEKYNKAREGATQAEIIRLNELERREKEIVNSFGSIFSSIFDTLTNAMDTLFKQSLTNLLKTSFSKGLEDISFAGLDSKVSGAIVAGAALAGNAISSIGGGKNTIASAAGGALSGAASGAVLGTAIGGPIGTGIGAAVGGLVGAIGGIFGSSKKRKEEELQKQQLEEQKKTNAFLDRQSRLSYSSQIIGRMTDRGVVSGVDVNEFGQLTTTISGSDIVVSYDRTKKNQARGR